MKAFLLLLFIAFSMESYASSLPDFPFVTVTGESVRKVTPDKVKLGFYVTTFDQESSKAQETLNLTANKVVALFNKYEVPINNVTSFEINKRAKRSRDKDYNDLAILGYEFTQQFEVVIYSLSKYSDIANELLDLNNVENIESQFDSSIREKIEIELIKEAAQKAKFKSEQMAAGLGVELGSVFAFNDSGSFSSFFATFGLKDDARSYAMQRMEMESSKLFIPQNIEIKKSINVIYKLKN